MKFILIIFLTASAVFGQQFKVEQVTGEVTALKGTSENVVEIKSDAMLSGDDMIITGENSSAIVIGRNNQKFILKENSALELDYLKEVSLNDLLLALAMEEIRDVPKNKSKSDSKNTAVYGSKISDETETIQNSNDLGLKKINGAKQLANRGYQKSAVILARETFRKYPGEKIKVNNRLFFTDILIEFELYNEAAYELDKLKLFNLTDDEKNNIEKRSEKINEKLVKSSG